MAVVNIDLGKNGRFLLNPAYIMWVRLTLNERIEIKMTSTNDSIFIEPGPNDLRAILGGLENAMASL